MLKYAVSCLMAVILLGVSWAPAQERPGPGLRAALLDSVVVVTDKPVYEPGDTLVVVVHRHGVPSSVRITPTVALEGLTLRDRGENTYRAVIPREAATGFYRIDLQVVEADGRRFAHESGRSVEIEEHQAVEDVFRFVDIVPMSGGLDPQHAMTLDPDQFRDLRVAFRRDSIRPWMGPQFVTIRTTVVSANGITAQTFERRVLTFRRHGDPLRDRALFVRYRTAYGPYAAISTKELDQVELQVDSLPAWAVVKVNIEPDYTVRIGAYDRFNSVTRYFRVRGPTTEIGFSLGIPKVLYDTQAADSIEYGNTSAMLRLYFLGAETGRRFPVSLGAGTFGDHSPIDVGSGRGGFALSTFLDLVEVMRLLDVGPINKLTAGLEVTPFFPLKHRARLLINAQVGFSI
jgi:hypothetical protein